MNAKTVVVMALALAMGRAEAQAAQTDTSPPRRTRRSFPPTPPGR